MSDAEKRKGIRRGTARTRKDVEQPPVAFQDLRAEVENESAAASPKNKEAEQSRNLEVQTEVGELTVARVVHDISNLGVGISDGLAKIASQMQDQVRRLNALREAAAIETRELERLHKIDVATTEIDALVREYGAKEANFLSEVEGQRRSWDEEKALREKDQKETEQALRRQRTREQDEYEYQKTLDRKKAQDEFDVKLRDQERRIKERNEELAKTWSAREAALKEREDELKNLRTEVDRVPERVKTEVDAAVAATTARFVSQYQQDMLIAHKDWETEKKVSALQIKNLEDAVLRQMSQIDQMQNRLEDSKKQVQDIAVRAIEGASGARALSHVSQIAMEQAKPRTPQT